MSGPNLWRDAWIPVTTIADPHRIQQVSIQDALLHADGIREIAAPAPLTNVAILRLLLAIRYRLYGQFSEEAYALSATTRYALIDGDAEEAYARQYGERFDLFHPVRPFYQIAELAQYEKARKPPTVLSIWRASERNRPTLYDQSAPTTMLSWQEAALGLITTMAYATGGLVSIDAPEHRAAKAAPLVLAGVWQWQGATLADTMDVHLAAIPVNFSYPAWEQEPDYVPVEREPRGLVDWYTWQSRRVLLIPSDDQQSVVAAIIMKGNHAPAETLPWHYDPMVATDADGQSLTPRGSTPSQLLADVCKMPVVQEALKLYPDQPVPMTVTWVISNQAKYVAWDQATITLPSVCDQPVWQQALRDAVTLAQAVEAVLKTSPISIDGEEQESPMRRYVRTVPQRDQERINASDRYWVAIEEAALEWLPMLGGDDATESLAAWQQTIQQIVCHIWQQSVQLMPAAEEREEEVTALIEYGNQMIAHIVEENIP